MISLTPVAATKVKEIMNLQNPVPTALRVAVVGGGCSGFQYHMAFENQTNESDDVFEFDGLKVAVDQMSSMYGAGAGSRLRSRAEHALPRWPPAVCDGGGLLFGGIGNPGEPGGACRRASRRALKRPGAAQWAPWGHPNSRSRPRARAPTGKLFRADPLLPVSAAFPLSRDGEGAASER